MMMVEYPSMLTRKRKSQTSFQPSSSDDSSAATVEGKRSNTSAGQTLQGNTRYVRPQYEKNTHTEIFIWQECRVWWTFVLDIWQNQIHSDMKQRFGVCRTRWRDCRAQPAGGRLEQPAKPAATTIQPEGNVWTGVWKRKQLVLNHTESICSCFQGSLHDTPRWDWGTSCHLASNIGETEPNVLREKWKGLLQKSRKLEELAR